MSDIEKSRARMKALYGENHKITDGQYDNVIAYRGIPYVGHQPVGEYRWKAPADFKPDDGVYEAHYFGTVPFQNEDHLQIGSMYPQSEECLFLNVWKAENAGTEKKPVMVWIPMRLTRTGLRRMWTFSRAATRMKWVISYGVLDWMPGMHSPLTVRQIKWHSLQRMRKHWWRAT